eukprot:40199_1
MFRNTFRSKNLNPHSEKTMGCCTSDANNIVNEKFNQEDIILKNTRAICGGVQSKGKSAATTGILVLTEDVLFYIQYLGSQKEEIEIRLNKIQNIKTAKSWLGHPTLAKWLIIEYKNNQNRADGIGIQFKGYGPMKIWTNKLKQMI